jgi:hypothetical protein
VNNPDLLFLLTVVLRAAALIAVVRLCLPELLTLLGLAFKNGVAGGPSDVEPDGTDACHLDFHRQLEALGFAPLGQYWEGMRFGKTFHELACGSAKDECFGMIFGLAHVDHHVAFVTTFTDGAAVVTKNIDGVQADTADLWASYVPTNCLADILAEHRRHVRAFKAAGHTPADDYTLPGAQAAELAYYNNPTLRAGHRNSVLGILLLKAVVVFALFFPTVHFLRLWDNGPGFWLALLAASVAFLLIERGIMRQAMRKLSSERREHDALT